MRLPVALSLLLALLTLLAIGCGREPAPSPSDELAAERASAIEGSQEVEEELAPEGSSDEAPAEESPAEDQPVAEDDPSSQSDIIADTPCMPIGPAIAFSEGLGTGAIAAIPHDAGAYLIASYALNEGRSLLRVHQGAKAAGRAKTPAAPRLLRELILREDVELARPHPPAIAFLDKAPYVAFIDEAGRLSLLRVRDGQRAIIEEQLDPRFSPALIAEGDHLLLAYSKSVEGVSRLFLRRVDRALKTLGALDLTPPAQSSSAPSFVRGADRPLLLAIDARLGFSPALLWDLGKRDEPRVVRPISHLVEPAFLRGAVASGELHIVYIARGIDLSHAIGWFREGERAPEPASVVPPLGFGLLRADMEPIDESRLLIAADRPLGREESAPREIVLRVLKDDTLSESFALRGQDGSAARPSLASLGMERELGLVYGTRRGLELAFIECLPR